jgi:8-oxo-dGTP diphosphatase
MPLYVCRTWDGEVEARQGQELAWVRAGKLAQYAMPPADEPLKAVLRDLL